jgi:hypothetical protein
MKFATVETYRGSRRSKTRFRYLKVRRYSAATIRGGQRYSIAKSRFSDTPPFSATPQSVSRRDLRLFVHQHVQQERVDLDVAALLDEAELPKAAELTASERLVLFAPPEAV